MLMPQLQHLFHNLLAEQRLAGVAARDSMRIVRVCIAEPSFIFGGCPGLLMARPGWKGPCAIAISVIVFSGS